MRGRRLALVAVLGGSLIPAAAPTASAYGLLEDTSSVPMAWMHVQTATSAAATITLPPDANGTTKPPPCPTPAYPGGPVADIGGCLPAPRTTRVATSPAATTPAAQLPYTGHPGSVLLLSGGALIAGGTALLAAGRRMRSRQSCKADK